MARVFNTIDTIKQFAMDDKKHKFACISDEYHGDKDKLRWKCDECPEKYEWIAMFNNVRRGSRCPNCAGNAPLTIEDIIVFAISVGIECISNVYHGTRVKLWWKCKENHEWDARVSNIKNGNRCPECFGNKKYTLEQVKEFASRINIKCLSNVYDNARAPMTWLCRFGHEWETSFSAIKNQGTRCKECKNSIGQTAALICIQDFFPGHKIVTNARKKIVPELGGLELDIYLPNLNTLSTPFKRLGVEYDGSQHHKYNSMFHKSDNDLKIRQKMDRKKNKRCIRNDINLIRVKYDVTLNSIREYLYTELIKLGYECPISQDEYLNDPKFEYRVSKQSDIHTRRKAVLKDNLKRVNCSLVGEFTNIGKITIKCNKCPKKMVKSLKQLKNNSEKMCPNCYITNTRKTDEDMIPLLHKHGLKFDGFVSLGPKKKVIEKDAVDEKGNKIKTRKYVKVLVSIAVTKDVYKQQSTKK